MAKGTCSFGDGRPVIARGWCSTHYARWQRTGNPELRERPRWSGMDPVEWFWAGFERTKNGCLEWQRNRDRDGYGRNPLDPLFGENRTHRTAWTLTNGPIPKGLEVRHVVCDNPPCGDVNHLLLGTSQDNHDDMVAKGRQPTGVRNGRAKLVGPQVLSILLRLDGDEPISSIAARFGVSWSTIDWIKRGRNWSHYSL